MAQKRLLKKSKSLVKKSPVKKRSIIKSLVKKRSIRKSLVKKSPVKKNYYNDPIRHRRSLHGDKFDNCYSSFMKIAKNTPSGNRTLKSNKEAIKYLKTHSPECIEIIGDYILGH